MDVNHLHLHVRDVARARRFYETYFGFKEHVRHGDILFLRSAGGFDLALAPAEAVEPFPDWFHFGFRLGGGGAVRALHARMAADRVPIARPLVDESDLVSFRASDPDGYGIEIYWE